MSKKSTAVVVCMVLGSSRFDSQSPRVNVGHRVDMDGHKRLSSVWLR